MFNKHSVDDLVQHGVPNVVVDGEERRLYLNKLQLQAMSMTRSGSSRLFRDWEWEGDCPPSGAYLPPIDVLRTFRGYHGKVQKKAHIWSFATNLNALASLTAPAPRKLTMGEVRPGARLLDWTGSEPALAEFELPVLLNDDGQFTRGLLPRSVEDELLHEGWGDYTARLFTRPGVDGWAKLGSDVLILLKVKGRPASEGDAGADAELTASALKEHIQGLMLSVYEVADERLKKAIEMHQRPRYSHKQLVRSSSVVHVLNCCFISSL